MASSDRRWRQVPRLVRWEGITILPRLSHALRMCRDPVFLGGHMEQIRMAPSEFPVVVSPCVSGSMLRVSEYGYCRSSVCFASQAVRCVRVLKSIQGSDNAGDENDRMSGELGTNVDLRPVFGGDRLLDRLWRDQATPHATCESCRPDGQQALWSMHIDSDPRSRWQGSLCCRFG